MPGTELLTIKQAAQYLNVSEISIRRWTDAGKLACLRIGGRRERRFEQKDLVNFLERQSSPSPVIDKVQSTDENGDPKIMLEGIAIDYGNHLCSLYETDMGRLKLSVPFLAEGLRYKNQCFLLASRPNQDHILQELMQAYPATKSDIENSRLIVSEGFRGGHDLYDYFEQQFLRVTRSGGQYIRVVSDMAWAIDRGMSVEDLMNFEARYNYLLAKSFAVVSLCQYDARRFEGTEILQALKSHQDTFRYPLSRLIGF